MEEKNLAHAQGADIPEELQHLKAWWKDHGDTFSTVLLVIALCAVGWRFYQRWQTGKESKAAIAYASVRSAEDMEAVIANHANSPVAPLAELRLASDYYHRQQYDQALDMYDGFLKKHAKHEFAPIATMGRAHTLEATGKFDAALPIYLQFIAEHPESYLARVATLGTARIAAFQGRKDDARIILDRMLAEYANTPWGDEANSLLAALPRLEFVSPAAPTIDLMDDLFNATPALD
ncbi:MAG: tetratricopeptide repeat protein [Kiritimatiellaeota bacterium]|nr:tetratricopeptide repeat protein [Kiritimatiellota bacterium]